MLPIALLSLVLVLSIDALPVPLSKENISIPGDLPYPLTAIEAIVNALDANEKNGPLGVRKQTDVRWASENMAMTMDMKRLGFKCYSGDDIVKVKQNYCGIFFRIVKKITDKIDCDMKYLVKSDPNIADSDYDLELLEERLGEYQSISVECKCFTSLCNKKENLNKCVTDAIESGSVNNGFIEKRDYRDVLKCISKQSHGIYSMDHPEEFRSNNEIMSPAMKSVMRNFSCYSGQEAVQKVGKYCGTILRIVKNVDEKITCAMKYMVKRVPNFDYTVKDLEVLEERKEGFQVISIQCKCFTSLCNTEENLSKCMTDAVDRDSVYSDFEDDTDLQTVRKCLAEKSNDRAAPPQIDDEMLISNGNLAFNSINNGIKMADEARSSGKPKNDDSEATRYAVDASNMTEAMIRYRSKHEHVMNALDCYEGQNAVKGLEQYCGLVLTTARNVSDRVSCNDNHDVETTSSFDNADEHDLVVFEKQMGDYKQIEVRCKCFSRHCNKMENTGKCVAIAVAGGDVLNQLPERADYEQLIKCITGKSVERLQAEGARRLNAGNMTDVGVSGVIGDNSTTVVLN